MDSFVGGRYISKTGLGIRVIERIVGDDIYWRDNVGAGRCSRESFYRWLGKMHPDSPEPPKVMKRLKPVSQPIIEAVRKELAALQNFRAAIVENKIETDKDRQTVIGFSLWQLNMAAKRLEDEVQRCPGYGSRLRSVTRIDTEAALLQTIISTLLPIIDSVSEESSKAAVMLLLRALADGSALINRLRSTLAPCLIQ